MAEKKQSRVELRLALAHEKLQVARDLLKDHHYKDVLSKAYYAMFYASKALLLELGEDPHRHRGVVSLFNQRIVQIGLSDSKYGHTLANAQRLREESDYEEAFQASQQDAARAIRDAENFVNEAQEILKKIQARGKRNVH